MCWRNDWQYTIHPRKWVIYLLQYIAENTNKRKNNIFGRFGLPKISRLFLPIPTSPLSISSANEVQIPRRKAQLRSSRELSEMHIFGFPNLLPAFMNWGDISALLWSRDHIVPPSTTGIEKSEFYLKTLYPFHFHQLNSLKILLFSISCCCSSWTVWHSATVSE